MADGHRWRKGGRKGPLYFLTPVLNSSHPLQQTVLLSSDNLTVPDRL